MEQLGWHFAGICSRNYGILQECENYGAVYNGCNLSGICGYGYNDSKIISCKNYGDCFNSSYGSGGIMSNGTGTIEKCINYGNGFMGGIVGQGGYFPYDSRRFNNF